MDIKVCRQPHERSYYATVIFKDHEIEAGADQRRLQGFVLQAVQSRMSELIGKKRHGNTFRHRNLARFYGRK